MKKFNLMSMDVEEAMEKANEPLVFRATKQPKIGGYWSMCCLLDLYRIETEADVSEVEEWVKQEEDEPCGLNVFETLGEAIAQLRGDLSPEEEAKEFARLGWTDPE